MGEDDAIKLRDELIRHEGRIAALEDAMAEQKPMLQSIQATLAQLSSYNVEVASGLRKAVFGNGNPGLVTTVTQLIERTNSRKELHDRDMAKIDRVLMWGGSSLVLMLFTIIGYLIRFHLVGVR